MKILIFCIFYFRNDSLFIIKQSNSISFVFGKAPWLGKIHLILTLLECLTTWEQFDCDILRPTDFTMHCNNVVKTAFFVVVSKNQKDMRLWERLSLLWQSYVFCKGLWRGRKPATNNPTHSMPKSKTVIFGNKMVNFLYGKFCCDTFRNAQWTSFLLTPAFFYHIHTGFFGAL